MEQLQAIKPVFVEQEESTIKQSTGFSEEPLVEEKTEIARAPENIEKPNIVTKAIQYAQKSPKTSIRRHRRDKMKGSKTYSKNLNNPSIRRLARRAGVIRICVKTYEKVRTCVDEYLTDIVNKAITYAEHSKRKTVTVGDVLMTLKSTGKSLYGYSK